MSFSGPIDITSLVIPAISLVPFSVISWEVWSNRNKQTRIQAKIGRKHTKTARESAFGLLVAISTPLLVMKTHSLHTYCFESNIPLNGNIVWYTAFQFPFLICLVHHHLMWHSVRSTLAILPYSIFIALASAAASHRIMHPDFSPWQGVWAALTLLFLWHFALHKAHKIIRSEKSNACLSCGYSLTGLVSDTCPECGSIVSHSTAAAT